MRNVRYNVPCGTFGMRKIPTDDFVLVAHTGIIIPIIIFVSIMRISNTIADMQMTNNAAYMIAYDFQIKENAFGIAPDCVKERRRNNED